MASGQPTAVPAPAVRRGKRSRGLGSFSPASLLFVGPAVVMLAIFLVYPVINTLYLSLFGGLGFDTDPKRFVGLGNYVKLLTTDKAFLNLHFPPAGALFNNVLWLVLFVPGVVLIGLVIAVVAARVRYEAFMKAVVFLPMAIAATALGVIWTFVYAPDRDTGLINAILGIFNVGPISFLGRPEIVNYALIVVGIWGAAGFATVVLSAALKSISTEILEAARVDGATEGQIFWRVIVPMLSLPISVVAVTQVIGVIKLFDLIFVMTAGGPGTSSRVVAFTMFQEAFAANRGGYGAAVAVIMLIILVPVIIFNIRRFRTEAVT
jgi:alpha-glucoside transport system permease protein